MLPNCRQSAPDYKSDPQGTNSCAHQVRSRCESFLLKNKHVAATRRPVEKSLLRKLGPGLITGASDDDPSGIATYSQVGAQFGFRMLWVMLFSYPLMAAIQEISARIGRVTGSGIAANMRKHYPPVLLYAIVVLLCTANVFNLGADIGAMGAAAQLLFGGFTSPYVLFFAVVCLVLQMNVPYTTYVKYLKWLTASLFSYVLAAFVVRVPWGQALRATLIPSLFFHTGYFTALIAVLGTTISPYLFFWQASQEAEEVNVNARQHALKYAPWQALEHFERIKVDTYVGMGFSNLVAFFIILTTAATLHTAGITEIQTSAQAAKALEPLAGRFTFVLFAAGIIGTGLLAVPVLAGSAAYGVAESFKWRASLQRQPHQAKRFYGVLAAATLVGLALNFVGIDPIRALFWSAVINGIVSVPVMVVTMLMSANSKVMGQFVVPLPLKIVGWVATLVMLFASIGLFATLGR
jgi:NRAMP (natural resistance-associated macrophage protein)-like metal ion transporter